MRKQCLCLFSEKPLFKLTFYQIELFGYGRYYKSMIENSDNKPPDEIAQNPEKMVEWFESSKSARKPLISLKYRDKMGLRSVSCGRYKTRS